MTIFDGITPPSSPEGDAGVAAPVVDPPAGDAGGAAAEIPAGTEGQGAPAPQPQYLDPEQFGSHLVKVKVAGEDVELPFSEALQSVMRQQDYTRKTQELAEERRKLQQADALVAALEANPAGTLKQLAEVYDLDAEAGLSPIERDPTEQRLVDMERQMASQQEAYARQMMQAEINALRAAHGDVDVMALGQFAKENGLTLTAAHQVMEAQKVLRQQQEAVVAEQRRQAAIAAQVTHDGTATQRGTVQPGSGRQISSIKDAWALAKEQSVK